MDSFNQYPPDDDANVASHSYGEVVALPAILIPLTCICVGTRCIVRKRMLNKFSIDDWLLVLSLILFIALEGLSITLARYGFGTHTVQLNHDQITMIFHIWYFQEILYLIIIVTIKISIMILLLRFLSERAHRITVYCVAIFYTLTGILFVFGVIFQCSPVASFWNASVPGTCVNEEILGDLAYVNATFSLATDLFCTIIPIILVWKMQIDMRSKVSIMLVLCLGSLATVASIVRFKYIDGFRTPVDNTFDYFAISLVSQLEIGIAIIATSLVICHPLLHIFNHNSHRVPTLDEDPANSGSIEKDDIQTKQSFDHQTLNGLTRPVDLHSAVRRRSSFPSEADIKKWEETCKAMGTDRPISSTITYSPELDTDEILQFPQGFDKT